MGLASLPQVQKVMVFGTFDSLHKGHLNFFNQARKYGGYLIIVVARDKNVIKIKGKLPKLSENQRLAQLKAVKVGERIILGQIRNPYVIIKKENPSIICLGYDQNSFSQGLKDKFPKIKIIRLKPYKTEIYKSSKLK